VVENITASTAALKRPPSAPSIVLFGDILGHNLRLPIARPNKYAPVSVVQTINKPYIKYIKPAVLVSYAYINPIPIYATLITQNPISTNEKRLFEMTVNDNIINAIPIIKFTRYASTAGKKVEFGPRIKNSAMIDIIPGTLNIDRKSTRLNSSHVSISYAVFCLKKKNK